MPKVAKSALKRLRGEALENSGLEEQLAKAVREKRELEPVLDKEGLLDSLSNFERVDLPWIERLDVSSHAPLAVSDVNDDLQRELSFYSQALAAVKTARGELERLGEAHRRPDDFYAEMLKSDDHMKRVRAKLLEEQRRMEAVERRQETKTAKKVAKQVQAERMKEKAAEKKTAIEAVKRWRKTKEGMMDDDKGDEELEEILRSTEQKHFDEQQNDLPRAGDKRKKRERMKAKYGFGGPKRHRKTNTSESTNEGRFSLRANKQLPKDIEQRRRPQHKTAGKGAKRPGKQNRQKRN